MYCSATRVALHLSVYQVDPVQFSEENQSCMPFDILSNLLS